MSGHEARVRLIVTRHTQTDDNAEHRYSGQDDVMLNETGIAQADELARKIASLFPVKRILSSDLHRAWTVARKISQACNMCPAVERFEALREVDVGRMTSLTKESALIQFPERQHRSSNPRYDYRDIGGEYSDDVASRVIRVIDEAVFRLTQEYGVEPITIVLVGHGTAFRTVFVDQLHAFDHLHAQGDFQVCDWFIAQLQ